MKSTTANPRPPDAAALGTARTQLQRVFDKTDCNRQADLVRLIGLPILPV